MIRPFILLALLLGSLSGFSQVNESKLSRTPIRPSAKSDKTEQEAYPIHIGPFNIPSFSEYFIAAEVTEFERYKITLSYQLNQDTSEIFIVSPFTETNFRDYFTARFRKLMNRRNDRTAVDLFASKSREGAPNEIQSLYLALKIGELATIQNTFEPDAAEICLNKTITVFKWKKGAIDRVLSTNDPDSSFSEHLRQMNDSVDQKVKKYFAIADQTDSIRRLIVKEDAKNGKATKEIAEIDSALQRLPNIDKIYNDVKIARNNINDEITAYRALYKNSELALLEGEEINLQWVAQHKGSLIELESKAKPEGKSVVILLENERKKIVGFNDSLLQLTDTLAKTMLMISNLEDASRYLGQIIQRTSELRSILVKLSDYELKKKDLEKSKEFPFKEKETSKIKRDSLEQELKKLNVPQNTAYHNWLKSLDDMPALEFEVEKAEIEFNEGLIENILVIGSFTKYNLIHWNNNVKTSQRHKIKFENRYPLGFSRKKDFRILQDQSLFAEFEGATLVMPLDNLISIVIQKHEVNRRDFSPQNHVYPFDNNSEQCRMLKKEATYKIFEVKVYSDFIGFKAGSPNGIIQAEIDRRINIRTQRNYWKEKLPTNAGYRYGDILKRKHRQIPPVNSGLITYIEPTLSITKIEEAGRYLPLFQETVISGLDTIELTYATTLDFKRFENLTAGLKMNLFIFDLPSMKSAFLINTGLYFGRVDIRDSAFINGKLTGLSNVKKANTFSLSFEFPWEIKADERYGFCFYYRTQYYSILDDKIIQTGSFPEFGSPQKVGPEFLNRGRWLNSGEIGGYFNPWPYNTSKSRFFFRYRLSWENKRPKHNFSQVQFGFSSYLVKK